MIYRKYPFFRITLFFVLGILIDQFIFSSWWLLYVLPVILSLFLFYRNKTWASTLAFCILIILGGLFSKQNNISPKDINGPSYGKVVSSPQHVKGWQRIEVKIKGIKNTGWKHHSQHILLYIKDSLLCPGLNDEILLLKKPTLLSSPKNPGEFDFKKYWSNKGITAQSFINSHHDYKVLKTHTSWLENIRLYLKNKIRREIKDKQSAAIVTTLFTGDKSMLDYNTKKSFAATGSVHILAVSGLHLGVIFMFATILFAPLKKYRPGKICYLLIVLTIIWGYALLTGLPSSIFRAALMFSIFTIAGVFDLRSTTINNTFFAAFIILLLDTNALFDPGFLFSFSAVLGIVILYRPLYRKVIFKNKILDYFWVMTCISIAAQITTFPLVIYYFHQFPVYFLISNFFLIPLAGFILYAGVAWLILSFIPLISDLLSTAINLLGKLIIFIVDTIHAFPGSLITSLRLSLPELFLLYLIIMCLCVALLHRKASPLKLAFAFSFCFFISKTNTFIGESNQKKVIVYHLPYHSALECIRGKSTYLIKDDWAEQKKKIEDFNINPAEIKLGITKRTSQSLDSLKSFHGLKLLCIMGQTIGIADQNTNIPPLKTKPKLDFLLITKKCYPDVIIKQFNIGKVIIDGSSYIGKNPKYHYTHHKAYIKAI